MTTVVDVARHEGVSLAIVLPSPTTLGSHPDDAARHLRDIFTSNPGADAAAGVAVLPRSLVQRHSA